MADKTPGESRKIIGVTPKFYIKDDGTNYVTGEEFNGLWSEGAALTPTVESYTAPRGYANIGHWKFNELEGNIAYNSRLRGNNDLFLAGTTRSTDAIGNYIQFVLPNNETLGTNNSRNYYIAMGSAKSGYSEISQFDDWLQTPGFSNSLSAEDGSTGQSHMKFMFDIWAWFRKPPQDDNGGSHQTLLSLYDEETNGGGGQPKVLTFGIGRGVGAGFSAGELGLYLMYGNGTRSTRSSAHFAGTSALTDVIYSDGISADGGLHHIGLIFDRSNLSYFGTASGPDGFYLDGKYYPITDGNVNSWSTDTQYVDTNALIGCEIKEEDGAFTPAKATGIPSFQKHFTGKIYQAQMCSIESTGQITPARMNKIYGLKFDIPRDTGKVDFSERYEHDGKNLLSSISTIKQMIETDLGAFTINISKVRAKN